MPDAITLLTSDHRNVEGLFAQVEAQSQPSEQVVNQIVKELSIHDAIERSHLYPAVRGDVPEGSQYADRSVHEHDQVAQTLLDVDKAGAGSPELVRDLGTLMELVRKHVEEEETQIFPAMRSTMSQADLDSLGETLAKAKESAPTRPHPRAPGEGLGTKVAGAMAAPLDKAKDAAQGRQ